MKHRFLKSVASTFHWRGSALWQHTTAQLVPRGACNPCALLHALFGLLPCLPTTRYRAEVTDDMRAATGGGGLWYEGVCTQGLWLRHRHRRQDGEAIEVLALPLSNAEAFLLDTSLPKSAGMMFAIAWVLLERAQHKSQ